MKPDQLPRWYVWDVPRNGQTKVSYETTFLVNQRPRFRPRCDFRAANAENGLRVPEKRAGNVAGLVTIGKKSSPVRWVPDVGMVFRGVEFSPDPEHVDEWCPT